LLYLGRTSKIRHAHMPGISRLAFARGARIDYRKVALLGQRMLEKLRRARILESHSELGTHLGVELLRARPGFRSSACSSRGAGATFRRRALRVAGDGRRDVRRNTRRWASSSVCARARSSERRWSSPSNADACSACVVPPSSWSRHRGMLGFSANSNRVGLVAVGVNLGIHTGHRRGARRSESARFAHRQSVTSGKVTGADWRAPTSFAACRGRAS
jgi:hypothetical protein